MTKKFEKLLAVLLAVCVFAAMLALPAVSFADTWDGSASAALAGEGTEGAPYLIATGADLAYFAAQVNGGNDYSGKYIKLTDDIDLNSIAFTPIGNTSTYFRGNFDGDGYTVSGLNISSDSSGGIGFFGACHNNTVKNLNVKGNVTATASKVAVAGFMGVATGVTIKNCTFDGTVYASNNLVSNGSGGYTVNEQNNLSAAGLVCNITGYVTIDRCVVSGTVDGFGRSGGLIGSVNGNFTANVTNSYCDANVPGKGAVDDSLSNLYTSGGLIGFLNNGTINLTNCFFAGTAAKARTNGMAGPVIHHYAGGVFNCTNTYYDSDKNTSESAGNEYGTPATSEEFADGTVLALLNTNPEEPVFEQGDLYPIFYVNKCEHTDVAAEWTTDKTNHWHVCNTCGEKLDDAAHTESDWIIDQAATEEATGLKHKVCTVCGYVLDEQVIPVYNPYAWDGTVSEFILGEGTEESPYIIANGADLAYFSEQVNGGNSYSGKVIKLTSDIDLNNLPFTPIGNGSISDNQITILSVSNCFKGVFDGDNHTISGLNIDTGATVSAGLFGACYEATIKNLNVKGSVKGTKGSYGLPVGGLVGCANNLTVYGCTFDGTVESTNTNQNSVSAAGIVSTITGGVLTIDKCSVSGKIIGFGRSGGILGQVNGGFVVTIKNSFCDAEVTGIYEGYTGASPTASGIVGFLNNGTVTVKDCFFAGTAPTARASGMAGPIINHLAGGVFSCINTYYDSDKNAAESEGNEYGTPATSEEFADGTVTALLNGDLEEPIYEQGETHPIFYVKVCAHENAEVVPAVASTCTVQGHGEYTVCPDCGAIIAGSDEALALDPDNHANTEIRDKAEATCTEAGYTGDTYCVDCGEKIADGEAVKALGHTGGTATCCKKAVCTRCKAEYGSLNAKNHTGGTEIKGKIAATEEAQGYTGDTYCKGCGAKLSTGKSIPALVVTYKITYKLDGGKDPKNPTTYTYATSTITLKNPTKKGYTFKGWYNGSKKVTEIKKGSKGNITLTAKWAVITYKITYKLNSGKNNAKNPASYKITSSDITLKAPTRKGYKFGGWYSDSKLTKKVTKIAKGSTGNKTLYAKWTVITYKITYKLNNGKNAAKNPKSYKVTTSTITLKAATRKGYTFKGWYNGSKKVTKIAKGSTGNMTLTAKWAKKK